MEKYWRSIEERNNPSENKKAEMLAEIAHKKAIFRDGTDTSRRDFLKAFGFTVAGSAILAGCNRPVEKAIPYLIKPEEVTPGKANYYATTYFDANEYGSVLVKVRDGRPIKIEGNSLSPISRKGTSARVQASVLDLYDDARFAGPMKNTLKSDWLTADSEITAALENLRNEDKPVALLTGTVISPTAREAIRTFREAFPNVQWFTYDAIPASGILAASEVSFGKKLIPDYHFDKAAVIVSFAADFLGTWLSPVEYTAKYSAGRDLRTGTTMSRHYQFEAALSVTGANADIRIPVKPSEATAVLTDLYRDLLQLSGEAVNNPKITGHDLTSVAADLWNHKGNTLVVAGSNSVQEQLIVNAINQILGNYGNTITFDRALLTRQGTDQEVHDLIQGLTGGQIKGLLCLGVNPVYDHPAGQKMAKAIGNLELSVSFADRNDETTALCQWVCPGTHYLESWGDAEPKSGSYSLMQPAIQKLFNSRQPEESLLKWTGNEISYYDYLRQYWRENMFSRQSESSDYREFWDLTLQKGVFEANTPQVALNYSDAGLAQALAEANPVRDGWELVLYESIALTNGKCANNPWLQELPDPVAKISWDNFASVPVSWAEAQKISDESVISVNGIELPVFVQPGQAENTIAVALGYGRSVAGKSGKDVGVNMYPFVQVTGINRTFSVQNIQVETTGKKYSLALSQTHHSMEGRPIARESTWNEWKNNPSAGNEIREYHLKHYATLYDKPEIPGHHWGLAVDLNACTGCGNCTIACQAENNIPVIGKEQVRNRRIMHWIRIDRYFSGSPENPKVSFQPVMCQHCDNAPCENVCPVAATPHSSEGLNQMAYNRCVGTRYCLNNCPYRVRRFNWLQFTGNDKFDYAANSDLGRMVLNPDVTVRSRGVVEKCSFCIQRIQEKKHLAKT